MDEIDDWGDRDVENAYKAFMEREHIPIHAPSKLVNSVAENFFNYSVEEPLLFKYGSYRRIDAVLDVGIVQPCIRTGDFARNRDAQVATTHSTLFHAMGLQYEFSPDKDRLPDFQRKGAGRLFQFLTESLNLDVGRVYINYFGGGFIDEILGKDKSERIYMPPDKLTPGNFAEAGFRSDNIIPTQDGDNLLATFFIDEEFYAGTKLEFLYEIHGCKIEIGTGELISGFQQRKSGRLVGIEVLDACGAPLVLGLERCLAAVHDNLNLFEIGARGRAAAMISEVAQIKREDANLVVDSLLPALCVLGQFGYQQLTSSLRGRIKSFIRSIRTLVRLDSLPIANVLDTFGKSLPLSLQFDPDLAIDEFSELVDGVDE